MKLASNFHHFRPKKVSVDLPAFTLVELMVVIAIIGILAALLLTAISQTKGGAQGIQCVGNLNRLGVGLQNFLASNHGYPLSRGKGHANSDYSGSWIYQLELGGLGVSQPAKNFFETGIWLCPTARWRKKLGFTPVYYGYNDFGIIVEGPRNNAFGLLGHYDDSSETFNPITESEVIVPSEMMAIGDSFNASISLEREDLAGLESYGNTFMRHQGKANVVFCDGHVESLMLQFLFEDTSDTALSRWNRDHLPHREKLTP